MHKKAIKIILILLFSFLAGFSVNSATDYSDDFSNGMGNWTIVDLIDGGISKWSIKNNILYQGSNIGNGKHYNHKDHRGSVVLYNNFKDNEFELKVDFNSSDNDGIGVIFGYQDKNNFYQVMSSRQRKETIVSRVQNNNFEILSETTDTYTKKWHTLKVVANNNQAIIYLGDKKISTIDFNQEGQVGLSVWASVGASFDNFSIKKGNLSLKDNNKNKLIRTYSSPEVYYIINNKRHKILSPEVFNDYGFKWEDVKFVSPQELLLYPPAKVVKTQNSSSLYYIHEPINKKKLIPNEKIFTGYGNKKEDVVIISQKDLDSYGSIRLIKTPNNPTVYELNNGIKKAIKNPEEFVSKGYQWGEIVAVHDFELDYYSTKMVVNGEEVVVAGVEFDETDDDKSFDSAVITGNRYLSVKTIKKNKEIVVPAGSIVPMLRLELSAGLEQSVDISAIEIEKTKGVSVVKNIFISNNKGEVIGKGKFNDENKALVKFYDILMIAPNSSQEIVVNVINDNKSFFANDQLVVASSQNIISNAYVSGSFPLVGDRFKIIDGSKLIGQAEISSVEINDGRRSASLKAKDQLVAKFIIAENSDNENIYLNKLKVYNSGSVYAQLENIDLIDQNNKIISTVKKMTGREIVFDLSFVPYKITSGSSQIFSIKADIVDGPGEIVRFIIQDSLDVDVSGVEYNFRINLTSKESFPIGRSGGTYFNSLKINDANTLLYKNNKSPVGNLVANSKDQVLGVFDIRVDGRDLNWEAINFQLVQEGNINLEKEVIIRDYKTKQIVGRVMSDRIVNKLETVNLDSLVGIKSGQTYTFEVVGNVSDKSDILDTYQVKIIGLDFQTFDGKLAYHFDYETFGNVLGIKRTNLAIMSDAKSKNQNISSGATKVLIGSFILQAGTAEDLIVNSFSVQEAPNYDTISFGDGYSNLKIIVNGKENVVYKTPNTGSFMVDKPFVVSAGKTASIKIYVDTTPIINNKKIKLGIYNVQAKGKTSELKPSVTGEGSQSFVTEFKQNILTVSKNSNFGNVVISANGKSQQIASFVIKNDGVKSIKINSFRLSETDGSVEVSYYNGYSNLNATPGGSKKQPVAKGNVFGGFSVGAGEEKIINVFIVADSSTVGDEFALILKDIKVDGGLILSGDPTIGQNVRVVAKN